MDALSALIPYITKPSRAVLTTHRNPDPDSVASNCALAHLLRELGHTVDIYSRDPIDGLEWISGAEEIKHLPEGDIDWGLYDYFWALDQGDSRRHGCGEPTIPIVNIDHHASNPMWGEVNVVQSDIASTCSIILNVYEEMHILPSSKIATTLLAGLAGDTGFFEYVHKASTFEDARKLMELGADFQYVRLQMRQQIDPRDVEFIAHALSELYVDTQLRVAILYVDEKLWHSYGVSELKTEYLLQYMQSIQGTDFGILFIESIPDVIRISLRARTAGYDVSRIALQLGGGGHVSASGARIERVPREDAIARVLACI